MSENQLPDISKDELHQARNYLNNGIQRGLNLLQEDMDKFPSFDPTKSYDEKNRYFIRTAKYGLWTLNEGYGWIADVFFRTMLDEILVYEQRSNKKFNKGMVYAILGISQIAQGKFDAGIAHLLTAEWEDREVDPQGHSILNTDNWGQFERKIVDYFISFATKPNTNLGFTVDDVFLKKTFENMGNTDRIFLQATILALLDNIQQNIVRPNNFTYGRLYSGLRDICLMIESLLRKKQRLNATTNTTLYNLLQDALAKDNIQYPQKTLNKSWSADNLKSFLDRLEEILSQSETVELRRAHCIHLIRNFTGHNFDIQEHIVSTKGNKSFGDLFESALENVMASFLYFSK